jgi:hypothetical protein
MSHVVPLGGGEPVLYRIEYPAEEGEREGEGKRGRVDVQWVVPFLMVMKQGGVRFELEEESTAMLWVQAEEVLRWARRCHSVTGGAGGAEAGAGLLTGGGGALTGAMTGGGGERGAGLLAGWGEGWGNLRGTPAAADTAEGGSLRGLDCHTCRARSFSVFDPVRNTTLQTSFLEVITNMTIEMLHVIAHNSSYCSKKIL